MLNVTDIGINHRNLNVVKIKNKYNLVVQRQKTYKMSKNHNDRTTSCTSVTVLATNISAKSIPTSSCFGESLTQFE